MGCHRRRGHCRSACSELATGQNDRPPGGSLEAYNAYLQGRFYALRETEADTRKAVESYTQAIELDPRFALAGSRMSAAWANRGALFLAGAQAQEAYAKARAAGDRALAPRAGPCGLRIWHG